MTQLDIFKNDLSLIQTVYGVSLVLGYREVASWIFDATLQFDKDGDLWLVLHKVLVAAVLVLTGVRFFWASGNIQRFVMRKERRDSDRKLVTVLHFPALLVHAFLFYTMCRSAALFASWINIDVILSHLVILWIVFLGFNCIWLLTLVAGRVDRRPENLWIKNNAATVALLLLAFTAIRPLVPTHIRAVLVLCQYILLVNCLVDLTFRADSYLAYSDIPSSN